MKSVMREIAPLMVFWVVPAMLQLENEVHRQSLGNIGRGQWFRALGADRVLWPFGKPLIRGTNARLTTVVRS